MRVRLLHWLLVLAIVVSVLRMSVGNFSLQKGAAEEFFSECAMNQFNSFEEVGEKVRRR